MAPDADYPRAVIFDLVCRLPEHTSYKQLDADDFHNISVVEFPTYTYVGKINNYSLMYSYTTLSKISSIIPQRPHLFNVYSKGVKA